MTLPPSLSELDAESEPELELSRITLVVGPLRLDMGLPPNVSIAIFIDDVIDIANDQIATRPELAGTQFDTAVDRWTLARLGSDPIDPSRSLSEANIYDGELLAIREIGKSAGPLLFDDVEEDEQALERAAAVPWTAWFARNQRMVGYLTTGLAAGIAAAWLLTKHAGDLYLAGAVLGLGVIGVIVACALAHRSGGSVRSQWVAVVATPLLFGGSLWVIPEGFGVTALPMACGLTALASLTMLLTAGNGRALHTAVIALCALSGAGATAAVLWQLPERTIGAALATFAVVVVYVSPRITIALSKLPIPRVPTAGEPLDDIETQGGTAVEGVNAIGKQIIPTEEGMVGRVRRANAYLTGMLVAATISAAVGCYLAIDVTDGFYWQGTVFAVAVATVLCLRGRSHHDLVQSGTLIGGGLLIALSVVVKNGLYVRDGQVEAAAVLLVLIALVVACGLVAPRLEFSPVMRRRVEILEYIAIAVVFPLCFWIMGVYAFFRELRIG